MRLTLEVTLQAVWPSDVSLRSIHEVTHISSHTGVDHHLTTRMFPEVTAKIEHVVIVESQLSTLLDLFCELLHGHCLLRVMKSQGLVGASVLLEDSVKHFHHDNDEEVDNEVKDDEPLDACIVGEQP